MRMKVLAGLAALIAQSLLAASLEIQTTGVQPIPTSQSRIVAGTISLPGTGYWTIDDEQAGNVPHEVFLTPPAEARERMMGRRLRQVESNRNLQRGRNGLSALYWAVRPYAVSTSGQGPASIDELDAKQISHIQKSPWSGPHADIDGPFVFLIPGVRFQFSEENREWVARRQREILAFELRPFVDDGKHWVLYTDGSCERETVNPALVKQYKQEIRPVTREADADRPPAARQIYTVMAVIPNQAQDEFELKLNNSMLNSTVQAIWRLDRKAPVRNELIASIERLRKSHWEFMARITQSDILASWSRERDPGQRRDRPSASVFGILGGRPAIEETLQMGLLQASPAKGERTLSIASIAGVTVKSHPYATMLGKTKVTPPGILTSVPADRLVLHVTQPKAILPFLNGGADFVASLGSTAMGSSIRYDLKDRYLARMGLDQAWLENLIKLGLVREFAIFAPDMFFIDGTDLTVISSVARPEILAGLLKLVNVTGLGKQVVVVRTAGGHDAFWAMRDDRLIVSTSRREIALAMQLTEDPEASLAKSVEYQYMLSQVPLQDTTRMMLYFSDPFIRRLVSPSVKIAQVRRAFARAGMEVITAAALRANLDGIEAVDIQKLIDQGYLPNDLDMGDITLEKDGRAVSATFGTLADPVALSAVAVDKVTAGEAAAYRTYLENYNRFWRQFFDPIAMRIDDTADGGLELTTFILPLIDNSLYDGIKPFLVHGDGGTLRIPTAKPDPVMMLSLNLGEPAWSRISEGLADMFMRYIFLSPQAIDDLGPALHIAIYDADPVIALGSGDIFGAFGGGMDVFGRGEMFMIPLALSVLTRPCAFMIETRDAARTARFLDQAATAALHRNDRRTREFNAEFYRIGNENAWVYTFSVMGMINLRFGIQIEGDYIVVRNIPWSSRDRIVSVDESPMKTARLAVTPGGLRGTGAGAACGRDGERPGSQHARHRTPLPHHAGTRPIPRSSTGSPCTPVRVPSGSPWRHDMDRYRTHAVQPCLWQRHPTTTARLSGRRIWVRTAQAYREAQRIHGIPG